MKTKTFLLNEIVEIHSTTDPNFDGLICYVLGIAFDHNVGPDHYIIQLPKPMMINGYKVVAIQLTEACLKPVTILWGGDFDEKQDAELERKHNQ